MDQETLKKVIGLGAMAPSGGNSQPWQFRLRGDVVEIIALPEKDHKILNFRNRGTWIAHGALIENIVVAAHSFGYDATIHLFPKSGEPNTVAAIDFKETEKKEEELTKAIPRRATNRKAYAQKPLTTEERDVLTAAAKGFPGGSVVLVEDPEMLKKLGEAVSVNEIVMLEEKALHNLFVHEVAWTEAEERQRGGGLLLETMELAPPQKFVLSHFIRHWRVARLMNKIGFARRIARDNAKIYSQTSAFGAVIVPDNDAAFIEAGRIMERVWLEATRLGLQCQLTTGILFMHQRLLAGDGFGISQEHVRIVNEAYNDIASGFPTKDSIALVFRVGHGDLPSAYSIKNQPVYIQ